MADEAPLADAERVAVDGLGDCDLDDLFDADDPPPGESQRGGRMLVDLADVLRAGGLRVEEVDGWQFRSRDGAGYGQAGPVAVVVHHTASGPSNDPRTEAEQLASHCDVAPMSNLFLDRSGTYWVCAAGATNTNGKGGPLGPLPVNSANSRVIGIEAGNNGIGESWPDAMQDAYVAGVAVLAEAYGIGTGAVYAHHEWAPTRKIDPAGPSRFGSVNAHSSWDMDAFRAAVAARRGAPPPALTQTPAVPATSAPGGADTAGIYVVQPADSWWSIAARTLGDPAMNWPVIAAANGGEGRVLHPGDVISIPPATVAPPAPPAEPVAVAAPVGPPFPGEVRQGDAGAVVVAWQKALIDAGVIRDSDANRDGVYGPGMAGAVRRLQQSWGWSNADGVAGPHTWTMLHRAG